MDDLIYKKIIKDLKQRIFNGEFPTNRLPDERSLTSHYEVSRSSIKRALTVLANDGIVFKKRGSGTFVNPLYLKKKSSFNYEGSNLGVTDSLKADGKEQGIKVLDFSVVPATKEMRNDLFLNDDDFVYQIRRLRLLDGAPVMIETGYIPIKIVPELSTQIISKSIFNYLEEQKGQRVTKSFLSISTEPSTKEDQELLKLQPNEPVGIMSGIFFLDDGTPFEISNMRLHYKYMNYNTFVSTN
ncbi:GntR family transcriptional regulator [Pediococcus argentinicus]|uniref:GntR family transcriptional regulator n=1 Tax=Pediococcus argentinicus TaxID=480391 RepID=A0A0R2NCA4_9LACO|nr:GntR family transcriptional regulator [Pediococcus argentinicus]KRO23513.1 GntR family transcriptional regulator [Pediococcus argentinicus]NKZ22906.1 GntR family transcriptional regulator [Pediococcus argentinicus]GEP19945.1 GntR family transcriptional regulator [Pediococcus argentinicus]